MFRILFKPSRGNNGYKNVINSFNLYTKNSNVFATERYYVKHPGEYKLNKLPFFQDQYDLNSPIFSFHNRESIINSPIMHYPYYQRNKTNSLYPYSTDSYNYFPKIIKDEMLGLAFCNAFNDYKEAFPEASDNEAGMFADDRVYSRHMIYGINPW